MSEVVRLYQYKGLLSGRRAVSADEIMAKLEISRATVNHSKREIREQLCNEPLMSGTAMIVSIDIPTFPTGRQLPCFDCGRRLCCK